MASYVFIWDIDGTLANAEHRIHHLANTPIDWDAFLEGAYKDELIPAGATLYNLLVTQCRQLGHLIQNNELEADIPYVDVMTGRPERFREPTMKWFEASGLLLPRDVHMRPDDDHRPDSVLKIEMYERIYKDQETVLAVFEDRDRCVKAWRQAGVTCYQVAEGKF